MPCVTAYTALEGSSSWPLLPGRLDLFLRAGKSAFQCPLSPQQLQVKFTSDLRVEAGVDFDEADREPL